jgi:hypothetical protein
LDFLDTLVKGMVSADVLDTLEGFDESGIFFSAKARQDFGKNGLIKKLRHNPGIPGTIAVPGTISGESQNFPGHAVAEVSPDGLQLILQPNKELFDILITVAVGLTLEILLQVHVPEFKGECPVQNLVAEGMG